MFIDQIAFVMAVNQCLNDRVNINMYRTH